MSHAISPGSQLRASTAATTRFAALAAALLCFGCGGDSPLDPSPTGGRGDRGEDRGRDKKTVQRPTPTPAPAVAAVATEPQLVAGINGFGLDVYRRLRGTPGNLAFSPASLGMALAMTWTGARGETADQMAGVLRLGASPEAMAPSWTALFARLQDPDAPFTLQIANRLFGEAEYAFKPPFLEALESSWGAPLQPVSFRVEPDTARGLINDWVEEKTEKHIHRLLPAESVTRETRLVLVNAVYFLGRWQRGFDVAATRPAPFHVSAGSAADVPTMHQTGSFRHASVEGLGALELTYEGDSLAMLILLPEEVDGLDEAERELTAESLEEIRDALAPAEVALALPRFKIDPSESFALGEVLRELGMDLAFDADAADFTGIADPPDPSERLRIDEVFHRTFVKVHERGTEAAATTGVAMVRAASIAPPPIEFRVDRPFLFFVLEKASGLVLFAGRVADPAS